MKLDPEATQRLRLKVEETQSVNVFLSSPFGGMEKERQVFIEQYLPMLKGLCESHGVFLKVCDLRWGISARQAEMNETLLICLKEIDGADIFAGMYGRRYGSCYDPSSPSSSWVLQSFQRAAQDYPWVLDHPECAITEVEFRHGFMNRPGQRPALVLFRDFAFDEQMEHMEGLSERERRKYAHPGDAALHKLNGMIKECRDLAEQRRQGKPTNTWANTYAQPEEGAKHLFYSLRSMLRQVLPPRSNRQHRLVAANRAYALTRQRLFVGMQSQLSAVTSRVDSANVIVVRGDIGSGKSTLCANVVKALQNASNNILRVAYHFVGCDQSSTRLADVLTALLSQLTPAATVSGLDAKDMYANLLHVIQNNNNDDDDDTVADIRSASMTAFPPMAENVGATNDTSTPATCSTAAEAAGATTPHAVPQTWMRADLPPPKRSKLHQRRRTVLVLDGLDQLEEDVFAWLPGRKVSAYGWFPCKHASASAPCTVIVSVASQAASDRVLAAHPDAAVVDVLPLRLTERKTMMQEVLRRASKTLTPDLQDRVATNPHTGNPLFLQLLLDELIQFGRFSALPAKVRELTACKGTEALLESILSRIDRNFAHVHTPLARNVVARSMQLIACAKSGIIPGTEMRDLLGLTDTAYDLLWSSLLFNIKPLVSIRSGRASFSHSYIRAAVNRKYMQPRLSQAPARPTSPAALQTAGDAAKNGMSGLGAHTAERGGATQAHSAPLPIANRCSDVADDADDRGDQRAADKVDVELQTHAQLAAYFLGAGAASAGLRYPTCDAVEDAFKDLQSAGALRPQPKRVRHMPNDRKVDELPFHLIHCRDAARIHDLLTDLNFLDAKAEAGRVSELVRDFKDAQAVFSGTAAPAQPITKASCHADTARTTSAPERRSRLSSISQLPADVCAYECFVKSMASLVLQEKTSLLQAALNTPTSSPVFQSAKHTVDAQLKLRQQAEQASGSQTAGSVMGLSALQQQPQQQRSSGVKGATNPTTSVTPASSQTSTRPDGTRLLTQPSTTVRPTTALSKEKYHQLSPPGHRELLTPARKPRGLPAGKGGSAGAGGADTKRRLFFQWVNKPESVDPCLMTLAGHNSGVADVSVLPDSDAFLLSSSSDNSLILWDAQSQAELIALHGHTKRVACCALARAAFDHKQVVEGKEDAGNGKGHQQQEESADNRSSADGDNVAGSNINTQGSSTGNSSTLGAVKADVSSPVAAAATAAAAAAATARPPPLSRHTSYENGRTSSLAVGDEVAQLRVFSGSKDKTVRAWDVTTGASQLLYSGKGGITSLAVLADGRRLAVGTGDKKVVVLQLAPSFACTPSPLCSGGIASSLAPQQPARGGTKCMGTPSRTEPATVLHQLQGHRGSVRCVSASVTSTCVLSCDEISLRVWDAAAGKCLQILSGLQDVTACCLSRDDDDWLAFTSAKTARVWRQDDAGKYAPAIELAGHTAALKTISAINGSRIATGGDDTMVRIWSVTDGTCLRELSGHVRAVACTVASSELLASGSKDKTVRLFDLGTALAADNQSQPQPRSSSASPLAGAASKAASGHTPQAPSTARPPLLLHKGPVLSCRVLGSCVITASADGTVKVWDRVTLKLRASFARHSAWVLCLACSEEHGVCVTGSHDTTLFVFDINTMQPLTCLKGHTDDVVACDISRHAGFVVSGSKDRSVRLWRMPSRHRRRRSSSSSSSAGGADRGTAVLAEDAEDANLGIWRHTAHTAALVACRFHPSMAVVLSCDVAGAVHVIKVDTGELIRMALTRKDPPRPLSSFALSESGSTFATGGASGQVLLFRQSEMGELTGYDNNDEEEEDDRDGEDDNAGGEDKAGPGRQGRRLNRAEARERVHVVTFFKSEGSLGLELHPLGDLYGAGVVIGGIYSGSQADGRLEIQKGDRVVSVNGTDVRNALLPQVEAVLARAPNRVQLGLMEGRREGRDRPEAATRSVPDDVDTGMGASLASDVGEMAPHSGKAQRDMDCSRDWAKEGEEGIDRGTQGVGAGGDEGAGADIGNRQGRRTLRTSAKHVMLLKQWAFGHRDGVQWENMHTPCWSGHHTDAVTAMAFAANDTLLVSASRDSGVKVWSANKGSLLANLVATPCALHCIAVATDPTLNLFVGDTKGQLAVLCALSVPDTRPLCNTEKGNDTRNSTSSRAADVYT